jgi:hypothetical protein
MNGDVWEYLILASLAWYLVRRVRRAGGHRERPPSSLREM